MELTPNALYTLKQRYLLKDETGKVVETPEQLFRRVSDYIASAELQYEKSLEETMEISNKFYDIMTNFEFLPNTPTLMNAGKNHPMLSACFTLTIEDTMEDIFEKLKIAAMIFKLGGGVGLSFSKLRPKDSLIRSSGGTSSGPISFIKIFNAMTEAVKQGSTRRGAALGTLRCDHPDILDFIDAKVKEGDFSNFNFSVVITDKFMDAIENDLPFELINPHTGLVEKTLPAKEIWERLCKSSWLNGEPAVIFIDTVNKYNPTPEIGMIESLNPCIIGDSLISTPYGKFPIIDLVGKEIEVYSKDDNGICIKKAINIRKTGHKKVIKIVTQKGTLTLTKEHLVKIKNNYGEFWIQTQFIQPKMRIVGLSRRQCSERWVNIGFGEKKNLVREHRLVAEYFYGDITNKDIHHKDGNSMNNIPSNLEVLTHNNHSIISNNGHIDWSLRDPNNGRFLNKEIKKKKIYFNNMNNKSGLSWRVQRLEEIEELQDVYNMEVEDTECFVANDMLIHNCGESTLLPSESCNLGSINLAKFYDKETNNIDYTKLNYTVRLAVRFLDDVITVNQFPLPEIEKATLGNRKIGLGIMGWADLLMLMGIRYDSEEALQLADKLMYNIQIIGFKMSQELGKERGNFPNFDKSIYKDMIYLRNATITAIAPTGTISTFANCSSSLEPIFDIVQVRHVELSLGRDLVEVSSGVKQLLINKGLWNDQIKEALESKSCLRLPKEIKSVIRTAHQVKPEWHIRMQAVFQKHVDQSISKTCNMPNSATIDDVKNLYMTAWKLGIKGTTVYRDDSRNQQLLTKTNCVECNIEDE